MTFTTSIRSNINLGNVMNGKSYCRRVSSNTALTYKMLGQILDAIVCCVVRFNASCIYIATLAFNVHYIILININSMSF